MTNVQIIVQRHNSDTANTTAVSDTHQGNILTSDPVWKGKCGKNFLWLSLQD